MRLRLQAGKTGLASRCNVPGKIVGDARVLSRIKPGDPIKVEKA